MGEGIFIGPKSSEHPVLRAYVRYLSTAVQRLFRMIRYYTVDSVNSAVYIRQSGVHPLYCSQSTIVLSVKAYVRWGTTVRLRKRTIVYVH
jgi:hypothetical protein